MATIPQHEVLRRGIRAAALLRESPRRVADLMEELELPRRDVQRMLAGLRAAGLELAVESRWRERYYSLPLLPPWLRDAIDMLSDPSEGAPIIARR